MSLSDTQPFSLYSIPLLCTQPTPEYHSNNQLPQLSRNILQWAAKVLRAAKVLHAEIEALPVGIET
jgi:hypothetical protein